LSGTERSGPGGLLGDLTTEDLRKSRVKGHWRKTAGGNRVYVRPYDTKVHKKPEEARRPKYAQNTPEIRPRVAAAVAAPVADRTGLLDENKKYRLAYDADAGMMWTLLRQQHYKFPVAAAGTVRETLQNSLDAIRKRINAGEITQGRYSVTWEADENRDGFGKLTIEDNGGGMGIDQIQDLFLTAGGSGKRGDKGTLGGFGVAKVIILGTVATSEAELLDDQKGKTGRWTLESRDYRITSDMMGRADIRGKELKTDSYLDGLKLTFEGFIQGMDKWGADQALKQAIELSQFPDDVKVTFNGTELPSKLTLSPENESPYSLREVKGNTVALHWVADDRLYGLQTAVRFCKGDQKLFQFVESRGGPIPGWLVIDVTTPHAPADDDYPFNTARCALSSEMREAVNAVVQHYIADPLSATLPPPDYQNVLRISAHDRRNKTGRTIVIRGEKGHPVTDYDWKKRQGIIKVWGDLVESLYKHAGYDTMPEVGIDTQDDHEAMHVESARGDYEILLNPEHFPEHTEPITQAFWLRDTLIHEMTHRKRHDHDEFFAAEEMKLRHYLSDPDVLARTFATLGALGDIGFKLPESRRPQGGEGLYRGRVVTFYPNGVFINYEAQIRDELSEVYDQYKRDLSEVIDAGTELAGNLRFDPGYQEEPVTLGRVFTQDWWQKWFEYQKADDLYEEPNDGKARAIIRRGVLHGLAQIVDAAAERSRALEEGIRDIPSAQRDADQEQDAQGYYHSRLAHLQLEAKAADVWRSYFRGLPARLARLLVDEPTVFARPEAPPPAQEATRALVERAAETVSSLFYNRSITVTDAERSDLFDDARRAVQPTNWRWEQRMETFSWLEKTGLVGADKADLIVEYFRGLGRAAEAIGLGYESQSRKAEALAYKAMADAIALACLPKIRGRSEEKQPVLFSLAGSPMPFGLNDV